MAGTVRRFQSGAVTWLELTPKAALAPRTKYQVLAPGGQRMGGVAGVFTTGEAADSAPPVWKGTLAATYRKDVARGGMCATGEPYLKLQVGTTADPSVDAKAPMFAVWMVVGTKRPDTRKPPLILVEATADGNAWLGPASICGASDLTLPPGSGPITLGVAALDTAGNRTVPRFVTVRR